jgi:beta-lactamase superfamily II metal-dependent hydrolase
MRAVTYRKSLILSLVLGLVALSPGAVQSAAALAAAPRLASAAPPAAAGTAAGALEVHFIDVGQGNATLVVSPSGKSLLVDTGERWTAPAVSAYLQAVLGGKTLDYIVISHYHADHFGSFTDLLRLQGVTVTTATYDRGGDRSEYNSAIYRDYYDFCTTENPSACKRTTIHEGDVIDLGPGTTATVLCSGDILIRKSCGEPVASENDNSVLLLVRFGTLQVWVGGDTSGDIDHRYYADIETAAVNLGRIGSDLDVYGVDHHGSCYSTNDNLVSATLPTVSVFSLGLNSYGHPCPTVVDRLSAAASAIYFTEDGDGTVIDGHVKITYTGGSTYTLTGTQGTTTFTTKTLARR